MKRSFFILIGILIAAGVLLRFQHLTIPDLTTDEAQYILPATAAHPPFGIALYQGAMALFGRELLIFRLVAAIVGILTLPLIYFVARSVTLSSPKGDTTALLATALAALFPPHILFSRLGYLDIIQCAAWTALLFCFLKAHQCEYEIREQPHSLLGKVLSRLHRKIAEEHRTMLWLTLTFLVSTAATFVKGQGLLFSLFLLIGLIIERRQGVLQSPLAWTLLLSLIPIGFYFLA
ncbi:MAG: glycosyltransferase family 39 protein, partial [Patescibacteria group bacterium]